MLGIQFSGWFQCRLARDPDPAHEPRGVSGATFALVNEPDLDRIIRLQPPCCERTLPNQDGKPGAVPRVGVSVTSVDIDGEKKPDHPLMRARVELLDDPKFEGWNNAVTKAGAEPIHPFHLRISSEKDVLVERQDLFDPSDPGASIFSLPTRSPQLIRRLPQFRLDCPEMRIAAGIPDPATYWKDRLRLLRASLKTTGDPLQRIALQQRIDGLAYEYEDEYLFRAKMNSTRPKLAWLRSQLDERAEITLSSQARLKNTGAGEWVIRDPDLNRSFVARRARDNTVLLLFELHLDWRAWVLHLALDACMIWEFQMNGPYPKIHRSVGYRMDGCSPWPIRFRMGVWDNDALCGYMDGKLSVPGTAG